MQVAKDAGLDKDFFIFRKREFEEILPWDFIDMGISKDALWAEYQEAITSHNKLNARYGI